MPIYEYHCGNCGHELEALQRISDRVLRKCPECGKSTLRRVVSAVRFRLKGGGWYETDFKSDGEKKRNLVETASAESSDAAPKKEPAAGKDGAAADKPAKAETAKAETAKPEPVRSKSAAKARARAAKKPAGKRAGKSARA